jgi:hypothetical protein
MSLSCGGPGAASGGDRSAPRPRGRRPGPGTVAPASAAATRRRPDARSPAPPAARSPACRRLWARWASVSRSMVRRSPTGVCQCARVLASPRNPRSRTLATSTSSSARPSPASPMSSCSWQLPGQPPSTHNRSPQMVLTATPWAVWVCRLASYSTFWLPHPLGRCALVPSPSTSTASPAAAISASHWPSCSTVVMKLPSGWQNPSAASSPSSRSRLSPTSVLEMPTMRPARRYDSSEPPSTLPTPSAPTGGVGLPEVRPHGAD